ncbi:hypothetical protein B1759_16575 [Rubrivirga sp. SAORIC476]|uniref:hypothetical protein n=1 Tax=Rubrivirga sp. SAORIC476 TaxID=1961794 RepID=UPI000BA981FD|nr:hypothetical protein [Rubrivirga sp. SAORIC476]PAP74793.1 hypothetical protein B1759_16575 [Rubrivirga sp. SAORIC476]
MDLSVICRDCKEPSRVKENARDRLVLSKSLGREFQHRCEKCGGRATYHIDDVTASAARTKLYGLVAAVAVAGVATVVLWNLGWVSTLTFILFGGIYFAIQQGAETKAKAFNSYKLGRSPKVAV